MIVKLTYESSTKSVHVYKNQDSAIVPVLYIKKKAMPEKPPEKVSIIINF